MKATMTATIEGISAFSGIGGFELGFARSGIHTHTQIEWDPTCQTILRRHFPHATLYGDISHVRGADLAGRRVELAYGGFPCQNTSSAAPHRAGLAGSRSAHFFEFTRLVGEFAEIVDDTDPRWVVIENPEGLLSSNDGRDMATVVRTLEDLGYGWAYRVVDGRHFRSAGRRTSQRRRRVIVVGHRGGDPRPAWLVLGDRGPGAGSGGARRVGGRPIGQAPALGAGVTGVWRKSARARAALDKGGYETWVSDGLANTLTGFDYGGPKRQTHLIAQHGRLRTLTFTEWERLQGFPDGWTHGVRESDLRRNKVLIEAGRGTVLGNAIHVGTAEWLGRRLVDVHMSIPQIGAAA